MRRLNETRGEPGELATASPRTAFPKVGSKLQIEVTKVTPVKKVLGADVKNYRYVHTSYYYCSVLDLYSLIPDPDPDPAF